jgi:hypothetical protein
MRRSQEAPQMTKVIRARYSLKLGEYLTTRYGMLAGKELSSNFLIDNLSPTLLRMSKG